LRTWQTFCRGEQVPAGRLRVVHEARFLAAVHAICVSAELLRISHIQATDFAEFGWSATWELC